MRPTPSVGVAGPKPGNAEGERRPTVATRLYPTVRTPESEVALALHAAGLPLPASARLAEIHAEHQAWAARKPQAASFDDLGDYGSAVADWEDDASAEVLAVRRFEQYGWGRVRPLVSDLLAGLGRDRTSGTLEDAGMARGLAVLQTQLDGAPVEGELLRAVTGVLWC